MATRRVIRFSKYFKSNILVPSLFAFEETKCVSIKIQSAPVTIPARLIVSIISVTMGH
jgi:hypothetical protein